MQEHNGKLPEAVRRRTEAEQSAAERALALDVMEDLVRRREARRPQELKWLLNLQFLEGNQYAAITPRGDVEVTEKRYGWESREVFNHIAPIVETRLAKLGRLRPTMTVRASSEEPADRQAAEVATGVLRGALTRMRFSETLNEGMAWSEACGTAFYKVVWESGTVPAGTDALSGALSGTRANATPAASASSPANASHAAVRKDTRKGAGAWVYAVSPFEVYPYSDAEDLEAQPSVIHARAYPVSEIENLWGVRVEGGPVETVSLGALGRREGYRAGSATTLEDAAVVAERYERPTRERPQGRLTVAAGERVLYDGPLPYDTAEGVRGYPFVAQRCVRLPGAFWGASLIERLIPVQRAYNAVKNRKYEFLNRTVRGVLAVEEGSVDEDALEEEGLCPGRILPYRQGASPPREMAVGAVPPDFWREEERLLAEFMLISGVSELMRNSGAYSENASGVALQVLAEQDDTRLSLAADAVKAAAREAGRLAVRLYRQFGTEASLLAALGRPDAGAVRSFLASRLAAEDVAVDTENELSLSPAQRRSTILQLLNTGLLAGEDGKLSAYTRARVLEELGYASLVERGEEETDETRSQG